MPPVRFRHGPSLDDLRGVRLTTAGSQGHQTMVDETTITLETEGTNAIEDAKASLSGLPTDGITGVRIELTRQHGSEDEEEEVTDGGDLDASETGRQGRQRKLQSVQQGSAFHTLLTYLELHGPATSREVDDDLDMVRNTIGSGLSDLWHRKLADREGSPPYEYNINQHGKCLLDDYGHADIPWADEGSGSESEKGSADGGHVIDMDGVESYEA